MSIITLGQRLAKVVLLLFFICLLVGVFRQIFIFRQIKREMTQKTIELREEEKKNQELRAKLSEAKSAKFVEEQTKKLLGLVKQEENQLQKEGEYADLRAKDETVPKYRQWWNLFVY